MTGGGSRAPSRLAERRGEGLLPDFDDDGQQTKTASEGIHIVVPSSECLLAMKAVSAQIGTDDDDRRLLAGRIGITTADQAHQLIETLYRCERVSPRPASSFS